MITRARTGPFNNALFPFPASQAEAHSEPGPAFQPGDRVWYLSIEPAKVCLVKVVRTWTGPWILAYRVAPDLYQIRSCNQTVAQAVLTAHVGRMRRFRPEFQEEPARSRPGSREVLPEKLPPDEGSSQTSNPQISTSCPPAGLGPKHVVEPIIPLSMRPCPNEYRSSTFLATPSALGPVLFRPGFGPVGPAGVRLPGVKLDWLAKTVEWAGSCNLS